MFAPLTVVTMALVALFNVSATMFVAVPVMGALTVMFDPVLAEVSMAVPEVLRVIAVPERVRTPPVAVNVRSSCRSMPPEKPPAAPSVPSVVVPAPGLLWTTIGLATVTAPLT